MSEAAIKAKKKPKAKTGASKTLAKKPRVKTPARDATNVNPSFVYVLGSTRNGKPLSYVGWTNDVAKRLVKHNNGTGARTTRGRAWILLHTEAFETRNDAMSREWHLKRDRAFRKKLLNAMRP